MSGLQIALFESSPTGERDTQNCLALNKLKQFLHQFSSFYTVFRYFDYQKLILVRHKHDIRSQHTQLHRIAYILPKYASR